MAKSIAVYQPKGYGAQCRELNSDDGTSAYVLVTPSPDDSTIKSLIATSTNLVESEVQIFVRKASADFLLATVLIPANAGAFNDIPAVDILASIPGLPLDRIEKPVLPLEGDAKLTVRVTTPVTGGRSVTLTAFLENF